MWTMFHTQLDKASEMRKINPIARTLLQNRRRQQVVEPKKGKGSYGRTKIKESVRKETNTTDETKA